LGCGKSGTISRRRAGICTGVGGGRIVICARLPLLARSDDRRLLACLKMSDATPLGGCRVRRWRGFKLRYEVGMM